MSDSVTRSGSAVIGRYGKTRTSPAKYGPVIDAMHGDLYLKFRWGISRQRSAWFKADQIELHPETRSC